MFSSLGAGEGSVMLAVRSTDFLELAFTVSVGVGICIVVGDSYCTIFAASEFTDSADVETA